MRSILRFIAPFLALYLVSVPISALAPDIEVSGLAFDSGKKELFAVGDNGAVQVYSPSQRLLREAFYPGRDWEAIALGPNASSLLLLDEATTELCLLNRKTLALVGRLSLAPLLDKFPKFFGNDIGFESLAYISDWPSDHLPRLILGNQVQKASKDDRDWSGLLIFTMDLGKSQFLKTGLRDCAEIAFDAVRLGFWALLDHDQKVVWIRLDGSTGKSYPAQGTQVEGMTLMGDQLLVSNEVGEVQTISVSSN